MSLSSFGKCCRAVGKLPILLWAPNHFLVVEMINSWKRDNSHSLFSDNAIIISTLFNETLPKPRLIETTLCHLLSHSQVRSLRNPLRTKCCRLIGAGGRPRCPRRCWALCDFKILYTTFASSTNYLSLNQSFGLLLTDKKFVPKNAIYWLQCVHALEWHSTDEKHFSRNLFFKWIFVLIFLLHKKDWLHMYILSAQEIRQ